VADSNAPKGPKLIAVDDRDGFDAVVHGCIADMLPPCKGGGRDETDPFVILRPFRPRNQFLDTGGDATEAGSHHLRLLTSPPSGEQTIYVPTADADGG